MGKQMEVFLSGVVLSQLWIEQRISNLLEYQGIASSTI